MDADLTDEFNAAEVRAYFKRKHEMNEKRTVFTDALATLGTIIGPDEQRDAIHLAVEPIAAGCDLRPGQDVFISGGEAFASYSAETEPVGIVDPFLKRGPKRGERFWLVVYPRTITSLRHVWAHPAFPDPVGLTIGGRVFTKDESAAFLTEVASRLGVTLDDVENMRSNGSFRTDIDGDRQVPPTFWEHFENYTGRMIPERERADYFSCGC